jgi:hypothetical protein
MRFTLISAVAALLLAVLAGAAGAATPLKLGPSTHRQLPVFQGYYDGHKDGYVITDVSSRAQAKALHVNFAPILKAAKGAPEQYFVMGRAAAGQLAVFASEPGETSYNPLWDEAFVTWKPGVKPVLLVKDDQIDALAKAGKLTITDPHIVLNAPITSVGSKTTVIG